MYFNKLRMCTKLFCLQCSFLLYNTLLHFTYALAFYIKHIIHLSGNMVLILFIQQHVNISSLRLVMNGYLIIL